MLGKLLKYDLKSTLKFISVFYAITIFLSVLTRFFINSESPFIVFLIGKILSGTVISMFASILINCVMRIWLKSFSRGVYGDESYLTHTLPVTKTQIYFSKFLTALIIAALSICVIISCAFIAYYTEARWEMLKQMLFMGDTGIITVLAAVLVFLEFINLIQCGFTGIILGHRQNHGKAGFSVLFAIIAETVSQIAVLIFAGCAALFSADFKQLFTATATLTQDVMYRVFAADIAIYVLIIAVIAALNVKLLKKGVDVE